MALVRAASYLINLGIAFACLWSLERGHMASYPEVTGLALAAANVILIARSPDDEHRPTSRLVAVILNGPMLLIGVPALAGTERGSSVLGVATIAAAAINFAAIAEPWRPTTSGGRLRAPVALAAMLVGLVCLLLNDWTGPLVFGGNGNASLFVGAVLVAFGALRSTQGRTADEADARRLAPRTDGRAADEEIRLPGEPSGLRAHLAPAPAPRSAASFELPDELLAELRAASATCPALADVGTSGLAELGIRELIGQLRAEYNDGEPFRTAPEGGEDEPTESH